MSNELEMNSRLLQALAEELKLPLLQIARQAELAADTPSADSLLSIRQTADMSLKLIEGYVLGLASADQQSLHLEPVSISSVLYDTAEALTPIAREYNCAVELNIAGKYGPVMADRTSLKMALLLVGRTMIDGRAPEAGGRLVLAVHKSKLGLVAGLFDNQESVSREMLKRGRALIGAARQALPGALSGSGASLYIANTLFESMLSPLRLARHQKLNGLATTLPLSKQLQLV